MTFQPTIAQIRRWGDRIGVTNETLMELDILLCHTLGLIARSSYGSSLVFKGGTALNKLYYEDLSRLSVDLDFNALGKESEVYERAREMREGITTRLVTSGLTAGRFKFGVLGDHFHFAHEALTTLEGARMTFKVEISTVERFSVLGLVQRDLIVPTTADPGAYEAVSIQTVELVELIATKIRALFQRRKGRDLYDLVQASQRIDDPRILRKLVLFYFACSDIPFSAPEFFTNVDRKFDDARFRGDLDVYLRPSLQFDWNATATTVRSWLGKVLTLDDTDHEFVLAVRRLDGSATGSRADHAVENARWPLRFLLGDLASLTDEASAFQIEGLERLMLRARRH